MHVFFLSVFRMNSKLMTKQFYSVPLNCYILKWSVNLLFWTWTVTHMYYINLKCEPIPATKEPGLPTLKFLAEGIVTDDCTEFKELEKPNPPEISDVAVDYKASP